MDLFAPLCNKLRFLCKAPSFKCIFSLNLTPVISLAVIYRSIIAGCVPTSQEFHLPDSVRAAPIACGVLALKLCLCRCIMIPYLWSSQSRIAYSASGQILARSRSVCRGHGGSSDVLAKVRTFQTKYHSIIFFRYFHKDFRAFVVYIIG